MLETQLAWQDQLNEGCLAQLLSAISLCPQDFKSQSSESQSSYLPRLLLRFGGRGLAHTPARAQVRGFRVWGLGFEV